MNRDIKFENKWKRTLGIGMISVLVLFAIFIAFKVNFNQIYGLLLKKDMEQVAFTSNFVTKLINTEIENLQAVLDSSQRIFQEPGSPSKEKTIGYLRDISEEFGFKKVGIADLEGNSLDSTGKTEKLDDAQMLAHIKNKRKYVSNVINASDIMLMAVPFYRGDRVTGVIWGHYSVGTISQKIELSDESHRYFQIIDDEGLYISDSGNIHAFTKDQNIWKELYRYELSDGITVKEIRDNVEGGRSGSFHFTYGNQGRYVTYEPLGINNWYVFSVLVEEYLGNYVDEIEKNFVGLLWIVVGAIMLVVGLIGRSVFAAMRYTKEQNAELDSKNSLLFMVMKHTNDIPFEINFSNSTLTVYRNTDSEKTIVRNIEYYRPDNMLKNKRISADEYEVYRGIYHSLITGKKLGPVVFKMKIDGKWDYNKIHIKTVNQDRVIGFLEDYNEQVLQERKIKEISIKSQTDPLTGLYNREYFAQECAGLIKKAAENGQGGISALFLLDLDYFKKANDTLGHMVGDQILRESSLAMKAVIRNTDLAGRLGGDEFVLFIQNARDLYALQTCAEKINKALRRTYGEGDTAVAISASIGAAVVTEKTVTFEELYEMADAALYMVKNRGRDGYYIIPGEVE